MFLLLLKFGFWVVLGTIVGGLIPSSVWLSQYSFLGQQGTKEDLWVFFSFGAVPGALIGFWYARKTAGETTPKRLLHAISTGFIGLIIGVAGGLYFAATLRKANWKETTAHFSRHAVDSSDDTRSALFSYPGGSVRVREGLWGYSEGDTLTIYFDPSKPSRNSFSNRPGYIWLAVASILSITLFIDAARTFMASGKEPETTGRLSKLYAMLTDTIKPRKPQKSELTDAQRAALENKRK